MKLGTSFCHWFVTARLFGRGRNVYKKHLTGNGVFY